MVQAALGALEVVRTYAKLVFIAGVLLAVAGGRFVLLNFGRAADVLRLQTATERLAAYSIGSVAAFWLIERTLSFYVS